MQFKSIHVSVSDLLLDPNNYRFQDLPNRRPVPNNRFHEPGVQRRATMSLRDTPSFEVAALKESIRLNGFVPIEQIVIRPYHSQLGKDVVGEGNRRVAALQWLVEDEESGIIDLDPISLGDIRQIYALVLDSTIEDTASATQVIMAIRHVSGTKEWGASQQARLIVEFMQENGATLTTVARRLGMSARETGRRFRASMALRQMESNEEYHDYIQPIFHGLFQETFASTEVRDWLEWDDSSREYRNTSNLTDFYSWICRTEDRSAKITTVYDVRKLRSIVRNARAIETLRDPDTNLQSSLDVASESTSPRMMDAFESPLRQALRAVDNMSASTVKGLSPTQIELFQELQTKLAETLDYHARLVEDPA
jgi:hypothetical protein